MHGIKDMLVFLPNYSSPSKMDVMGTGEVSAFNSVKKQDIRGRVKLVLEANIKFWVHIWQEQGLKIKFWFMTNSRLKFWNPAIWLNYF